MLFFSFHLPVPKIIDKKRPMNDAKNEGEYYVHELHAHCSSQVEQGHPMLENSRNYSVFAILATQTFSE